MVIDNEFELVYTNEEKKMEINIYRREKRMPLSMVAAGEVNTIKKSAAKKKPDVFLKISDLLWAAPCRWCQRSMEA